MPEPWLVSRLQERAAAHLLRKLVTTKGLVDFTSNDYLGLAHSDQLFQNIARKSHQLVPQNGAGGSRLLSGNDLYTEEVEDKLAAIFDAKSALIFNSGYTANLAVLSSIPNRNDTIIYDELAHACMKDGARLSLAKRLSFKHNDLNDLDTKLRKSSGQIYVAVESIYSMDGDTCPLNELIDLCDRYQATVILDEAHSTGILGHNGSGLAVSMGLADRIGIRIHTFGKAMGIHGACVVGSPALRNYLINFARPFIYTTALPPHCIVAIDCAFEHLSRHMELQQLLTQKVKIYEEAARAILQNTCQPGAIQTLMIPGNEAVKQAAMQLQQLGFDVRAILSPTVAPDTERLRICLHTYNHDAEITDLVQALRVIIAHR